MSVVDLHSRESAPEGSRAVMDAYLGRFGFVPNLINIMAESPAATQGYAHTYGLLAETDFSPAEKAIAVSPHKPHKRLHLLRIRTHHGRNDGRAGQ